MCILRQREREREKHRIQSPVTGESLEPCFPAPAKPSDACADFFLVLVQWHSMPSLYL